MTHHVQGQSVLPEISVKEERGRVIISWLNEYKLPINHIHVQRSYDSLRHYTTIGSVLNPGNLENGYADNHPPYAKMYYRIMVSFQNGEYILTSPARPMKISRGEYVKYFWDLSSGRKADGRSALTDKLISPSDDKDRLPPGAVISKWLFLNKDNNPELHLPEAGQRKYRIRFTNESGKTIIEIREPAEETLIIEKVNFIKSGIFAYEILEAGKLVEKGQIEIGKDLKNNAEK